MSKIAKIYLQYLLILYQNIQIKPIYMLSLGILTYVIQICTQYIILFIDFEKFKGYNNFKKI